MGESERGKETIIERDSERDLERESRERERTRSRERRGRKGVSKSDK